MKHVWLAPSVLVLCLSCNGGEEPATGEEGGSCYPNATCNDGLTCLSDHCVVWEGGSDAGGSDGGADSGGNSSGDLGGNNMGLDLGGIDFGEADAPPAGPTALNAVNGDPVTIALSWTDNSDDEGGFVIERRDEFFDAAFIDLALVDSDVTEYVDSAVVKGVEYTYRVRALNGAGDSELSNEAGVRTPWPTLQVDIVPIFEVTCGSGNVSCHARNQYAATADRDCRGWLSLENTPLGSAIYDENLNETGATGCPDQDLHYRLTRIRAWQCGESDFVSGDADYAKPGDPENSYLWQKIEGTRLCDVGDAPSETMPNVGELDPVDRILIRQWLAGGAAP